MKKTILYILLLPLLLSCKQEIKRPNFLVILTDDQRPQTLGCYDASCPIKTPHIDALATDGIRFTQGFVTTPICAVSRASIFTGRYSSSTGMTRFHKQMPDSIFNHTYNMYLQQSGYYTGQVGKYGVASTKEQHARIDFFQGQASQGPAFRQYKGREVHDSEWLALQTSDFLDSVPEGQPFCLQLNYKAPHFSSKPAPEDKGALADYSFTRHPLDNDEVAATVPEFVRGSFLDVCYREVFNKEGDHNPFSRDYYEKVMSLDRSVGRVRQMLEERGLADNTIIIYLSDHGAHFGDRHFYGKWSPYDPSLKIPFIVYDPRPQGRKQEVRDEMVLNIDIAPTLLELAGVDVPEIMDGRSLTPLFDSKKKMKEEWRNHFYFEHYQSNARSGYYIARNEGVRTLDAKYLRWLDMPDPIEEYYNLKDDPYEINNLFANSKEQMRVKQLKVQFENWRKEHPDNYEYNPYIFHPTTNSPDIDWKRFKEVRPEVYEDIARQVKRLKVTWEQAVDDWDIRHKISKKANYWY